MYSTATGSTEGPARSKGDRKISAQAPTFTQHGRGLCHGHRRRSERAVERGNEHDDGGESYARADERTRTLRFGLDRAARSGLPARRSEISECRESSRNDFRGPA